MISRTELNERIREWGIREDVIEKDYIQADPAWTRVAAVRGHLSDLRVERPHSNLNSDFWRMAATRL